MQSELGVTEPAAAETGVMPEVSAAVTALKQEPGTVTTPVISRTRTTGSTRGSVVHFIQRNAYFLAAPCASVLNS